MRRHLNYANVVATFALVFAMSGGALAAKHYLINSTKQINPKVLKKLKGNAGKTGLTGLTGLTGPAGPAGKNGENGKTGGIGPSKSYQNTDEEHVIPEPGGGLGTPIDTLNLPAGTYLVSASGTITREGLTAGQGASQTVQLRRKGSSELLLTFPLESQLNTTGGAAADYGFTRLVTVAGGAEAISVYAFDSTSTGTKSTATKAALTATLVGEASGAL